MSALLDKVNSPGSLLAGVAAAPTEPVYLAPRSLPVTSTPIGTIIAVVNETPTCIEPCRVENEYEQEEREDAGLEPDKDIMSS